MAHRIQRAFNAEKLATILLYGASDVVSILDRLDFIYQFSRYLLARTIVVCREYDNGNNTELFRSRALTAVSELEFLRNAKQTK